MRKNRKKAFMADAEKWFLRWENERDDEAKCSTDPSFWGGGLFLKMPCLRLTPEIPEEGIYKKTGSVFDTERGVYHTIYCYRCDCISCESRWGFFRFWAAQAELMLHRDQNSVLWNAAYGMELRAVQKK